MTEYANALLVVLLALDLYMVSTSRLDACIRASALQGIVLAALPFVLVGVGAGSSASDVLHLGAIAAGTLLVKSVFIPWLLFRALRDLGSTREFEPFVSLHLSQLVNGALCGAAFWIAAVLPWPTAGASTMALGVGLATLFIGVYMTVNRRKTVSQVLGFLVIESALLVIGWTLLRQPSLILEIGALLDVLVAVMVMGILATRLEAASDGEQPVREVGDEP
ncbi:MAG: hydrogenase [Deltaproteobacteria bacterium]|nr:hydrogenase [Deltaproteobacteria bacterium]